MRFPKETRALIHEAAPHPVTIPWPGGKGEPKKGRIYWLQNEEDAEEEARKAKARREHSPETCAEVLAGMYRRYYGNEPKSKGKRRRPRSAARLKAGDPRLIVIDTTILERGWEAKVALYEDPDPVTHLGIKARVPAGPNPIDGRLEKTETEPEQIIEQPTHARRLEEEQALKIAHKASTGMVEVLKAERQLLDLRRKDRRSKLAEEALERVRRRVVDDSAGASV